jgi:protein SCO1/2
MTRLTGAGRAAVWLVAVAVSAATGVSMRAAAERHPMTGLVLKVDAAAGSLSVSCDGVPGFMPAMVMPFAVRTAGLLDTLKPGATIEFMWVIDGDASYVEDIHVRRYESLEQKPLEFLRLELLSKLTTGDASKPLAVGDRVPDFSFIDQRRQRVTMSKLEGQVVTLTFAYMRCPSPTYCFRLATNLSRLQKRFAGRLGKDLVLMTIVIDPELDQGAALAEYARTWTGNAQAWHFLTGPLAEIKRVAGMFGVEFWQDEGSLIHSFHTTIVDRHGMVVANLDGNAFTAEQLGDLVQTVLER